MPESRPSSSIVTFPDLRSALIPARATALVFADPQSQALCQRLQRIAPSEANILISGETGTGKELVARYVHDLSKRRQGPFVAVNCAALSESLVESELFGHERGAFTGAIAARVGWFEAAAGGTLFLDEVGDIPLPLQGKLLRVLQEREIVRLGSRRPIPVDVRLITATNVNLEAAVAAGHFRKDLYYRINIALLHLLPLRERPGDVIPLAHHFLNLYAARVECPTAEFAPETLQQFERYPWPGNIRELENVIHHALLVSPDGMVRPADVPFAPLLAQGQHAADQETLEQVLGNALDGLFNHPVPNRYDFLQELLIRTAYRYCNYNQVQTARLLGISRNTLRTHLKRLNLLGAVDAAEGSSSWRGLCDVSSRSFDKAAIRLN